MLSDSGILRPFQRFPSNPESCPFEFWTAAETCAALRFDFVEYFLTRVWHYCAICGSDDSSLAVRLSWLHVACYLYSWL